MMENDKLHKTLSFLKDIPVEPNWAGFENRVMDIIDSNKRRGYRFNPSLMPVCGLLLAIGLWIILSIGFWTKPSDFRSEPMRSHLTIREQNLIKEYPELKQLLAEYQPVCTNGSLEEHIKTRYPQLKGGL